MFRLRDDYPRDHAERVRQHAQCDRHRPYAQLNVDWQQTIAAPASALAHQSREFAFGEKAPATALRWLLTLTAGPQYVGLAGIKRHSSASSPVARQMIRRFHPPCPKASYSERTLRPLARSQISHRVFLA